MRPTLKNIAEATGYSVMTVSNVLSGKNLNHASGETQKAIRAAAERLGYRPNLSARQLVTRRSNIIGLLIDSTAVGFYREVMRYLERAAFQEGYRLQVGVVHENYDSIRQYVNDLAGFGVDKVVCAAHNYPQFGSEIPKLFEGFKSVVFLEEPLVPTTFPVVATDHERNYHDAVAGLFARGRRRVICCARRSVYKDPSYFAARRGVESAYAEAKIAWEECFWVDHAEFSPHGNAGSIDEVLGAKPDGLIVARDLSMFTALKELRARAIAVPEEIALFSAELSEYAEAADPTFAGFNYNAEILAREILLALPAKTATVKRIASSIVWGDSAGEVSLRGLTK